jgi:hypothetical protein
MRISILTGFSLVPLLIYKGKTMLLYLLFGAACIFLILVLAGVQLTQRALNISFLIILILVILERTGWVPQLS